MSRIIKNLIPKTTPQTLITDEVKEIIYNVLKTPIRIPDYLNENNNNVIKTQISPYDNSKPICFYKNTDSIGMNNYFKNYIDNRNYWENTPFSIKREIFLEAAYLIETKYYNKMLAYTILGQNKNMYEGELDAVCELVDFLRFNTNYAHQIINKQPIQDSKNCVINKSEYNPLNGFVAAITPFNFTAIGGNLASAPLLFGNSVIWKPSDNAILSNHLFYEIMLEAGLPRGVLNFCPNNPSTFLVDILNRKDLAAILFTGSSKVMDNITQNVGNRISNYNNYPRIVGETGGKNFHFIGPYDNFNSSVLDNIVTKTIESSFNYSGQKCSACSIVYVPENIYPQFVKKFKEKLEIYKSTIQNYGVINSKSFDKLSNLIDELKKDDEIEFIIEGNRNDNINYLIEPNLLLCKNHNHKVFNEEFFGPILTIFPYNENKIKETIDICINSNNYALTGAIFSDNENFKYIATDKFKNKTGNFYVNDKSTGSVVGQQPFGGSGKSGTNDKAGDINLLYRLFNQRNIKIG
jgi:1-pyrroline-5-carboxylate dehydrogenase